MKKAEKNDNRSIEDKVAEFRKKLEEETAAADCAD
jgi:hypothetical protein